MASRWISISGNEEKQFKIFNQYISKDQQTKLLQEKSNIILVKFKNICFKKSKRKWGYKENCTSWQIATLITPQWRKHAHLCIPSREFTEMEPVVDTWIPVVISRLYQSELLMGCTVSANDKCQLHVSRIISPFHITHSTRYNQQSNVLINSFRAA